MKLRPIDREKLLTIRAGLKHGDVKAIAEITGFTWTYVSRVLRGAEDNYNPQIIKEAIKLYNKNKRESEAFAEEIDKALGNG